MPTYSKPLVSICVPVYNHEKFIVACLESIISQTYQNIELIVIDDGSSDSSAINIMAMQARCEARFKRYKFISRSNKGLSNTLNEGLNWSQGTYFCGLASDDLICEDKTSMLVDYLENHSNCVTVFGSIFFINEYGVQTGTKRISGINFFNDVFLLNAYLPALASLSRLQNIKDVGGYNVATKIEDWDLWLRLTYENNLSLDCIPDLLAMYRLHAKNTSSQFDLMHSEQLKIIEPYKNHIFYDKVCFRLNCVKFRNIAIKRKKEAFVLLKKLATNWKVFFEGRFYQGIYYLIFKW